MICRLQTSIFGGYFKNEEKAKSINDRILKCCASNSKPTFGARSQTSTKLRVLKISIRNCPQELIVYQSLPVSKHHCISWFTMVCQGLPVSKHRCILWFTMVNQGVPVYKHHYISWFSVVYLFKSPRNTMVFYHGIP